MNGRYPGGNQPHSTCWDPSLPGLTRQNNSLNTTGERIDTQVTHTRAYPVHRRGWDQGVGRAGFVGKGGAMMMEDYL